jgi:hypothetical protein
MCISQNLSLLFVRRKSSKAAKPPYLILGNAPEPHILNIGLFKSIEQVFPKNEIACGFCCIWKNIRK